MKRFTQTFALLSLTATFLLTGCLPGDSGGQAGTGPASDAVVALAPDTGLAIVDFYADWCGPCRQLAPVLERIAEEGIAEVVKINVDENGDLARKAGVRSIPAVFIVKDGVQVDEFVGRRSSEKLLEILEPHRG
jgi:thioredoxin 1